MRLRRLLVLASAGGAFALPVAHASAAAENHEVTRSSGIVSARLSWQNEFQETKNFRIEITRDNAVVVNEPVEIADCGTGMETTFACPWPVGNRPLEVRDLDGDAEPEVIVTAFTGGAHCCVVALIYRWNGTEYVTAERNFFGAAWKLVDPDDDGRFEFRTLDYRFDYLFGSHAESVFPIQIIRFNAGKFVDVTTDFPRLVRKQMGQLRREYERRAGTRRHLGVRAALAAYVADLYLLDRRKAANRVLNEALDRGLLDPTRLYIGPDKRKFIRKLKKTLRQFGY